MHFSLVSGHEHTEDVCALFTEYTQMLVDHDPLVAGYLSLQRYDAEIADLAVKYGSPYGRLYLCIADDGTAAGCVALKKIDDTFGELKRLYVKPSYRGNGIARRMVGKILEDAAQIGYQAVLLDTLPFLHEAIELYHGLGFYDIPSYNNSPMESCIYMRFDLPVQK